MIGHNLIYVNEVHISLQKGFEITLRCQNFSLFLYHVFQENDKQTGPGELMSFWREIYSKSAKTIDTEKDSYVSISCCIFEYQHVREKGANICVHKMIKHFIPIFYSQPWVGLLYSNEFHRILRNNYCNVHVVQKFVTIMPSCSINLFNVGCNKMNAPIEHFFLFSLIIS